MQVRGPKQKPRIAEAADDRRGQTSESDQPPDPAVCPNCAAVFRNGVWTWASASVETPRHRCPACRRIADEEPAAIVFVRNSLIERRRDEVFALIRNTETLETQTHAMERIMRISDDHYSTTIATTGIHIAERVAHAIADVTRATITTRVGDDAMTVVVA